MVRTNYDIYDRNRIYEGPNGFNYSLPRDTVENQLSGNAFDWKKPYSDKASARLKDDIVNIYSQMMKKSPIQKPLAVITVGAPGAGKTCKMRQELAEKKTFGKKFAYIDPDDVCLKKQKGTYLADIEKLNQKELSKDDLYAGRVKAYTKWRPASNGAMNLILANLIREKFAFYYGTTSTSPYTYKFFGFLKEQGYKIKLIHVTTPDDVRWASIQERDKTFIQTTLEDTKEKGKLLPQRINDTVLEYADKINFCFRSEVDQDAQLAATWRRNEEGHAKKGTLNVHSQGLYDQIKTTHNQGIEALNMPQLKWESTVEEQSLVIFNV